MGIEIGAKALRIINYVSSGQATLTGPLVEAYERSSEHKFNEGDILVAAKLGADGDMHQGGFGGRPVALISAYEKDETSSNQEYVYRLVMHFDHTDPETGDKTRRVEEQTHFKWNIENHFKRAPKDMATLELALESYRA